MNSIEIRSTVKHVIFSILFMDSRIGEKTDQLYNMLTIGTITFE